jgi:pilus assembly protein CpaE
METNATSAAVVYTDASLRQVWAQALTREDVGAVDLRVDVAAPYNEISADQVQALRQEDPSLVLLDLSASPAMAIRFASFLVDLNPRRQIIAAGGALAHDELIAAMQAGVTEYLPAPVTAEALGAAIRRAQRKLGASASSGGARAPGQLIALFSAKGGSGTTTVAANLAVHLHRLTGKKTLLLDADLELGEAAVHLGMQPRFNFVDMVRNFHRMDSELLASYIECHASGVHLLSAPLQPERPEAVTLEQIRGILRFLRQHYDFVVVDTSRSFSSSTTAALEQADRVFLIATADLPSLRNIKRCLPLLDRITGQASEKVRLVINRFQEKDPIGRQEVEQVLGMSVHCTLANDYAAVAGSISAGTPVVLNGSSQFAKDLRKFGAPIAGIEPAAQGNRRFGPLSKLFGRGQEAGANAS